MLAIFAMWIVDAQFLQAEHGEPHAQNLPGAEMAMGLFRIAKILVQGFHEGSLSAFSHQPSA
jgi:hypothetical protein